MYPRVVVNVAGEDIIIILEGMVVMDLVVEASVVEDMVVRTKPQTYTTCTR